MTSEAKIVDANFFDVLDPIDPEEGLLASLVNAKGNDFFSRYNKCLAYVHAGYVQPEAEKYLKEIYEKANKQVWIKSYCIAIKWNYRVMSGGFLKREEDELLHCPLCQKGILQVVKRLEVSGPPTGSFSPPEYQGHIIATKCTNCNEIIMGDYISDSRIRRL
ncbi:MAG: hypothetical protein Q7S53_02945 [bacterium]|nr:hypothetical protein [bacterium]